MITVKRYKNGRFWQICEDEQLLCVTVYKRGAFAVKQRLEKEKPMMIKITVEKGVVVDVETSEPAIVQIVDLDADETSTFETAAQAVEFEPEGHEADALLNHEVMADPLKALFKNG
jgi:hypothetical protein